MLDGLWTAEFQGISNFFGGAVVILNNRRLYGGDSQYYYTGFYDVKDRTLTALIQVAAFVPGATTIFGTQERNFTIQLSGTVGENFINVVGTRPELPNLRLSIALTKRADLP
jgi:hypothetical protein